MSGHCDQVVTRAKRAFASGLTKNILFRRSQLKQLYKLLDENEAAFVDALNSDLKKSRFESIMTEIDFVLNDIRSALNNLEDWAKQKAVSKCFVTLVDDNYIHYEPYGVVLILGAWNYPIQLAFSPLVGAIAAGNACIVKPSEVAPATACLIQKLMPNYLDAESFHCILGDGTCAQKLVGSPDIDYVFFTGSSQIGRMIYKTAATNLTPCTLEMGGKSPVYIDEQTYLSRSSGKFDDALFRVSVKRILWGKFLNTGQTCVAPDYVLCTRLLAEKFMKVAAEVIEEFYGDNPIKNKDYGRIVSSRHYERLTNLLKEQSLKQVEATETMQFETMLGGKFEQDSSGDYYVEPTIIVCRSTEDPIMRSEIFGPILPLVLISGQAEAINFINSRDKPLSLYVFSKKAQVIKDFETQTSSGSICVNDTVMHLIAEALPFGGVGKSGIGAYHGKHSFKTFSHQKSVLVRGFNPIIEWVAQKRYPPYSENHLKRMLRLLKRRSNPIRMTVSEMSCLLCFFLGVLVCYLYMMSRNSTLTI